jgi:hypothetical protein
MTLSGRLLSSSGPDSPDSRVAYHRWMQIDMKTLAREGAQARLAALTVEITALHRAFPGLDGARGRQMSVTGDGHGHRGGRKRMSAAEKKAVSVRMKKYWAARRKNGGTSPLATPAHTAGTKVASAPKRTMSAAARARISAAQKKRWAAWKRGAKKR